MACFNYAKSKIIKNSQKNIIKRKGILRGRRVWLGIKKGIKQISQLHTVGQGDRLTVKGLPCKLKVLSSDPPNSKMKRQM